MSPSTPATSNSFAKLAGRFWWIPLVAALALYVYTTTQNAGAVLSLSESDTWSVDGPELDSKSPTGYSKGQRWLVIPGHHAPSFWWIAEAQGSELVSPTNPESGDTLSENKTIGRTTPYRLWLVLSGKLHQLFTGDSAGRSIEQASLFADPLLFASMMLFGALLCFWKFGKSAAVAFTIASLSLFPLNVSFQAGAPDSHGLSCVLALASLLPLCLALNRPSKSQSPLFALAGLSGGLGFWCDPVTQAPVLLATVLASFAFLLVRRRTSDDQAFHPTPWRVWSVGFTFIALLGLGYEIPSHELSSSSWFGLVTIPLFCLGSGEILIATEKWIQDGKASFKAKSFILPGFGLCFVILWPFVALSDGNASLLADDFYARQLANHPDAGLAANLGLWLERSDKLTPKWALLLPCILLIATIVLSVTGKSDRKQLALVSFVVSILLFAVILATLQLRWWNLVDVVTLCLVAVLFSDSSFLRRSFPIAIPALAVALLPGLLIGMSARTDVSILEELDIQNAQTLVERDYAYWLNKRDLGQPITLFSTPLFSDGVGYYGGFEVIASSDPTNEGNYNVASRIVSADSDQEVSILLNSRKVTHIALPHWDPMLDQLIRIGTGTPPGQDLPAGSFAVSLREWDVPPWLRVLSYTLPKHPQLESFPVQSFVLHGNQDPALALSRLADSFVEKGRKWEAESIRSALENYPRNPVAMAAIANIDYLLGDTDKLSQNLDTLIPSLSRRAARNLPVDRRISLSALLIRTQNTEPAKEQLREAMGTLDSTNLQLMSPDLVAVLLALSQGLKVPFPDENLKNEALGLIPPGARESLLAQ